MKTTRILSRSIATLIALAPFAAHAVSDTLTGLNPAWGTGASWSLGLPPGISDNAVLAATGVVDVNGTTFGGLSELQDLLFSSASSLALTNNSSTDGMVLVLNGGRGAGVPLIGTVGNVDYSIQASGSGAPPQSLGVRLKASGSIDVASAIENLGLTIGGDITETGGSRSITKTGAGRLTLSGFNSFTGGVTVSGGILEAASNGALGSGAAVVNGGALEINTAFTTLSASSITVNAGGKIAVRDGAILNNAVTLAGGTLTARTASTGVFAGAVGVTGNSFVDLRSYLETGTDLDVTIGGALSGSSSLTIDGNITGGKALILTNTPNTFSGSFIVKDGQNLRSAPATTGNTLGTGTVILNGGTLQVRDNGTTSSLISYNNAVVVQGSGGTINVDRASGTNTGKTVQFGGLTMGAQTLNISGANGFRVTFSGPTTLTGAATISPTSAVPLTRLNGVISGGFDLTKGGAGPLRLDAVNTYTGQTHINAGTLALNALGSINNSPRINVIAGGTFDVSGVTGGFKLLGTQTLAGTGNVNSGTAPNTVTVLDGGKIAPGDAFGTGTLTMTGLTFGAAAGQLADVNFSNGTTPAKLNVSGANRLIANGGANSVALNLTGAAPALGTYVLIDYSGAIGGTGVTAFRLGTLPARLLGATLVNNTTGTSIDLSVTSIDFPVWTGALSNAWSTATLAEPKNWVRNSDNGMTTDFLTNDNVVFNDLGTRTTVNVGPADVVAGGVTFNNTAINYTLTGSNAITGNAPFTKSGTGSVTIQNTNSFTGSVNVNGGKVIISTIENSGTDSPLGAGSAMTFNGGTLEFTGASGSTDRAVTMNANGGTVLISDELTLAGAISGAGALTKSGAGKLILTGANTYGATVIAAGTMQVGDGGSTGALGSGPVTNNGTLTFNRFDAALTVNSAISGTGMVTNAGFGTVTLGGATANTYSGGTTVTSGTIVANKTAGINAIPGDLTIEGGGTFRIAASNQVADTATVFINGGAFGDLTTIGGPPQNGPIETMANVIMNGGTFLSHRNTVGMTITNLLQVNNGMVLAQRGGVITAGTVFLSGNSINLDGGSTTAANESRLNVGAGGLTLEGGTINFNAGPSAVGGGSTGSIVRLDGDVTSMGTSSFVRQNAGVSNALVDLAGATRIFNVTDVFTIGGIGAPIAITNGNLTKTGDGTLEINGPVGAGTAVVNANDGTIRFGLSQTLGQLNIGDGGVAALGEPAFALAADADGEPVEPGADGMLAASPVQAVPEPGSVSLLVLGAAGLLRRRRDA